MATRSFIAVKTADGYQGIYCHWDGYPEGVGKTLCNHYYDPDKVFQLMELGDLSALDDTIESTEAYGRDRGETDVDAKSYSTLQEVAQGARDHGSQYVYLYENYIWKVKNGQTWVPLEWNKSFHGDATSGGDRCLDLE